jgi:cytosine/adenosine deaminase-related metal-dependent hydrolase
LLAALHVGTEERYAEIRALVGGVTAIQGASGRDVSSEASLVRHVDLPIFGRRRARTLIDLPFPGTPEADFLKAIVAQIGAKEVDAFYLHLAEGQRDDAVSRAEFDRLVALDGLTAATIIIHGSALTRAQLENIKDAGAKLVWSPQSNLRLYGETTRAADALTLRVPMALGADWLPSGSLSLMAELKVARRVLADQGYPVGARQLVEMVTSTAATIAGLGEHLGAIQPGRPADLLVVERHHEDPYHNVVEAEPGWVELVVVNGTASYGRSDWVVGVGGEAPPIPERVTAWGKPMLAPASLSGLRSALIAQYPQTGPIFA